MNDQERSDREPMPMAPHAFERGDRFPEECRRCGGAYEDHHDGVKVDSGFDEPRLCPHGEIIAEDGGKGCAECDDEAAVIRQDYAQ